jgi:hypothetical protein
MQIALTVYLRSIRNATCRQTKPLAEFYEWKRQDGRSYHSAQCKACYLGFQRQKRTSYQEQMADVEPAAVPISIPLSEKVARVQRDAQDLVWILSRNMIRSKEGATYLRLRPREDDPKHRTVALKVERLVTGLWDAALGNSELGLRPSIPGPTGKFVLARREWTGLQSPASFVTLWLQQSQRAGNWKLWPFVLNPSRDPPRLRVPVGRHPRPGA